jgi:outer membrane protein OmpA-like peptidoglycan-associated protein
VDFKDSLNRKLSGVKLLARYKNTGNIVDSTITDHQGFFALNLPFDQELEIIAEKPGYEIDQPLNLSTHGLTLGVDSVEIEMRKKDLLVYGKIFSKETQSGLQGVTINIINLSENNTEKKELDSKSNYSIKLKRNCSFRIEFSKSGYITKSIDITTQDINAKDYNKDILMEEEFIDLVTIHFDYKKSNLTGNAVELLFPLMDMMIENPDLNIQILAHADSRGTKEYNLKLSELRAASALNYLTGKGIDLTRIKTRAFGESLLLNDCYDDQPCNETKHAENRRVELILQYKDF